MEEVQATWDYKEWLKDFVYKTGKPTSETTKTTVNMITGARFFQIRKRADGAVVFWSPSLDTQSDACP